MFVFRKPVKGEVNYELLWGAVGLALLLAAWCWPFWGEYYAAVCPMKMIFGVPCPLCGGTRAMHAWTHGHLLESWGWNPLGAIISALATLYIPYAALALLMPNIPRIRLDRPAFEAGSRNSWLLRVVLIALLASNWAYLVLDGR